eukprot:11538872-Prorocentrum_lima.AAC.1
MPPTWRSPDPFNQHSPSSTSLGKRSMPAHEEHRARRTRSRKLSVAAERPLNPVVLQRRKA